MTPLPCHRGILFKIDARTLCWGRGHVKRTIVVFLRLLLEIRYAKSLTGSRGGVSEGILFFLCFPFLPLCSPPCGRPFPPRSSFISPIFRPFCNAVRPIKKISVSGRIKARAIERRDVSITVAGLTTEKEVASLWEDQMIRMRVHFLSLSSLFLFWCRKMLLSLKEELSYEKLSPVATMNSKLSPVPEACGTKTRYLNCHP